MRALWFGLVYCAVRARQLATEIGSRREDSHVWRAHPDTHTREPYTQVIHSHGETSGLGDWNTGAGSVLRSPWPWCFLTLT